MRLLSGITCVLTGALICVVDAGINVDTKAQSSDGVHELSGIIATAKLQRELDKKNAGLDPSKRFVTGDKILPMLSDAQLNAFTYDSGKELYLNARTVAGPNVYAWQLDEISTLPDWTIVTSTIETEDLKNIAKYGRDPRSKVNMETTYKKPTIPGNPVIKPKPGYPISVRYIGKTSTGNDERDGDSSNYKIQDATHHAGGIPLMIKGGDVYEFPPYTFTDSAQNYEDGLAAVSNFYINLDITPEAKAIVDEDVALRGYLAHTADKLTKSATGRLSKINSRVVKPDVGGVTPIDQYTVDATELDKRLATTAPPLETQNARDVEAKKQLGHLKTYNSIVKVRNAVFKADPKGGKGLATCGSSINKRRLSKRAGGSSSCNLASGDSSSRIEKGQQMSNDDIMREEASAIYEIGQALDMPEVGLGYNGERPPSDGSDSTELGRNFIFKGSANMDNAIVSFKDAANAKLQSGKLTDKQKQAFAKAIAKLEKCHDARAANLARDRAMNVVNINKQSTYEGRNVVLSSMKEVYSNTFGNAVEKDNPNYSSWINQKTPGGDDVWSDDDFSIAPLFDYRPDEIIGNVVDAEVSRTLMSLGDDTAGIPPKGDVGSEPTTKTGDAESIPMDALVPGSTNYRQMWTNLRDRTIKVLLVKSGKFQALDRRLFFGGMAKWKESILRKEAILAKKQAEGKDIKAAEIADYETQHDAYGLVAEKAAMIDTKLVRDVEPSTGKEPEIAVRDTGFVTRLETKKTFQIKAGKPSDYKGTVGVVTGTSRTLGIRKLFTGRGNKPTPGKRP